MRQRPALILRFVAACLTLWLAGPAHAGGGAHIVDDDATLPAGQRGGSCTLSQIRGAATTLLVVERQSGSNYLGNISGGLVTNSGSIGVPHAATAVLAFADGHVESLRPADTVGTGTLGSVPEPCHGMWTIIAGD